MKQLEPVAVVADRGAILRRGQWGAQPPMISGAIGGGEQGPGQGAEQLQGGGFHVIPRQGQGARRVLGQQACEIDIADLTGLMHRNSGVIQQVQQHLTRSSDRDGETGRHAPASGGHDAWRQKLADAWGARGGAGLEGVTHAGEQVVGGVGDLDVLVPGAAGREAQVLGGGIAVTGV